MSPANPDVAIVGGGVIGLTTAYWLARQHVSVTVFEKGTIGRQASWAGAGMLPPGNLAMAQTPEARLRSYSHALWDELSADLKQRSAIDTGYLRCGAIQVFDAEFESAFTNQLARWQQEQIAVEFLDRNDIQQRFPALNTAFSSCVFLPDFGQVRNPRHLKALAMACRQMGVVIEEHCEDLSLQQQGLIASVRHKQSRQDFDRILVAAGAWTSQILAPIGTIVSVKPVRGQMVQLQVHHLPCRAVIELNRRYIVPRSDGLVLVGSTEDDVGFHTETTTAGISGLLNFATQILPDLSEARVLRTWAGLRPGSPNELPFLGKIPEADNLFVAAGHFRSGLQMSAGTGKIMADLLTDQIPAISLEGFEIQECSDSRHCGVSSQKSLRHKNR